MITGPQTREEMLAERRQYVPTIEPNTETCNLCGHADWKYYYRHWFCLCGYAIGAPPLSERGGVSSWSSYYGG